MLFFVDFHSGQRAFFIEVCLKFLRWKVFKRLTCCFSDNHSSSVMPGCFFYICVFFVICRWCLGVFLCVSTVTITTTIMIGSGERFVWAITSNWSPGSVRYSITMTMWIKCGSVWTDDHLVLWSIQLQPYKYPLPPAFALALLDPVVQVMIIFTYIEISCSALWCNSSW